MSTDAKSKSKKSASSASWRQARLEILDRTDVQAELESLGLRFASGGPNAAGWLSCHAIGREDRSASGSVYMLDGPNKGSYRDFGAGVNGSDGTLASSFFDTVVLLRKFGDWREAVKHYAKSANVKLPKEIPHWRDKVGISNITPGLAGIWCKRKGGISIKTVVECGGRLGLYPVKAPPSYQQQLIAFPAFGPALVDGEPSGWHAVNATAKEVTIHRGKGNPPGSSKTIQLGETGLLNWYAINHLESAEVIWVAEGLSDMLTLHEAICESGLAGKHIVVASGGAKYQIYPEWKNRLAGKDIRLVFDVDEAGRQGAAKWAAAFADVASVRNVDLGAALNGKGKDVRDWLLTEGNKYPQLVEYSETFPVLVAGEKEAVFDQYEAIAKELQFHVAGEIQGTNDIEVFSLALAKKVTIRRAAQLSRVDLIQYFGRNVAEIVADSVEEDQPGKYTTQQVKEAIAALASERRISDATALGPGVWGSEDSGDVLVVGQRGAWKVVDGDFEPFDGVEFSGRIIHLGSEIDWFDVDAIRPYLALAKNPKWRESVWWEGCELFSRWDNWNKVSSPRLVTSLVIATWVQSLWVTRPQVFVTGKTNSGKSWLIERTLQHIFGGKHTFTSKPTEAGIRQRIKDGSFPILVDEVDKCPHRQKVYDLMRTSTVGSTIAYGTADQRGKEYGLKHIAWLGGIETALNEEADQNRFIVLGLDDVPTNRPSKLELLAPAESRELGRKFLALALTIVKEAKSLVATLSRRPYGCDRRLVSVYSVPMAIEAICLAYDSERASEELKNVLADQEAGIDLVSDEEDLVESILDANVSLDGGGKARICDLLIPGIVEDGKGRPIRKEDVLAMYGLRAMPEGGLFVYPKAVRSKLLDRDNRFRESRARLDQILLRIRTGSETATRSCQRLGGGGSVRGVIVPGGFLSIAATKLGGGDDF